jgi:hypothetical protein
MGSHNLITERDRLLSLIKATTSRFTPMWYVDAGYAGAAPCQCSDGNVCPVRTGLGVCEQATEWPVFLGGADKPANVNHWVARTPSSSHRQVSGSLSSVKSRYHTAACHQFVIRKLRSGPRRGARESRKPLLSRGFRW